MAEKTTIFYQVRPRRDRANDHTRSDRPQGAKGGCAIRAKKLCHKKG